MTLHEMGIEISKRWKARVDRYIRVLDDCTVNDLERTRLMTAARIRELRKGSKRLRKLFILNEIAMGFDKDEVMSDVTKTHLGKRREAASAMNARLREAFPVSGGK